jgi:hypothetical protein
MSCLSFIRFSFPDVPKFHICFIVPTVVSKFHICFSDPDVVPKIHIYVPHIICNYLSLFYK